MIPPPARNSNGSRKLKKAALGLRQNMRRSRRYCFHARMATSAIGGQLQVQVLERRAAHAQLLEALAAGERFGCELSQQPCGIVRLELDQLAVLIAVGDAIDGRPGAELPGRADREDAPVLHDRDAVGEL